MSTKGRRPGPAMTRAAILDAARERFAASGYAGASVRAIAEDAGVDPALVHYFFATKAKLFASCLELPLEPASVVSAILEGADEGAGRRLVATFLSVWDQQAGIFRMLAVNASTEERVARMLREFVVAELLLPIVHGLGSENPELRAALAGSQLVGLAMFRYVFDVAPLSSQPAETVAELIGPTLEHYLRGTLVPSDAAMR